MTREEWLEKGIQELRTYFDDRQYEIPERVRVACGWPSRGGTSESKRVLGECWHSEAAVDGTPQIFISPFISDPVRALDVLVHELIHACLPEAKHGKKFKVAMKELGLTGKATATVAGDDLRAYLVTLAEKLGDYNHSKLDKVASADAPKPQKNRQLKVFCPRLDLHENETPYILRGSNKTLDLGTPKCGICGTEMEREAEKEDEGEE